VAWHRTCCPRYCHEVLPGRSTRSSFSRPIGPPLAFGGAEVMTLAPPKRVSFRGVRRVPWASVVGTRVLCGGTAADVLRSACQETAPPRRLTVSCNLCAIGKPHWLLRTAQTA
jgi:hypothetical protein